MKKALFLTMFVLALTGCHKQTTVSYSKAAIFRPGSAAIQKILNCQDNQTSRLSCTLKVMEDNSASVNAMAFTKALDGLDFMTTFKMYGKIAFVKTLEIGADHSSGAFLVNGTPAIININDPKYIGTNWPTEDDVPVVKTLPNKTTSYQFNYPIKTCHACKVTGTTTLSFIFDQAGKLLSVNKENAS